MNKRKTLVRALLALITAAMLLGTLAIYASATDTARLVVNPSNGRIKITVNGAVKHTGGTAAIDVEKGAEVTITAIDGQFLFLTDSFGNTCTEESSYTFTVRSASSYTVWFEEPSGSAVIYRNSNNTNQVLSSATFTDADNFTEHLKESAVKYGYEFYGWNLTVDEIKAKITAGEKTIIVAPVYKEPTKTYTVNVEGGVILETESASATVPFMEKITLVANEPAEGLYFLGWKNSAGDVISAARSLELEVFESDTYTAQFSDTNTAFPSQISMSLAIGNNTVRSQTRFFVESGMTLVSYGVLFSKNTAYDSNDMVLENVNGSTLKMVSYTISGGVLINNFFDCTMLYARAFLIYTDGSNEYTVYSDVQTTEPSHNEDIAEDPFYDDPDDPSTFTPTKTYENSGGAVLNAYASKTVDTYESVCNFYEKRGYSLYCETNKAGNLFSTYTKGSILVHVYWIEAHKELNVVTDNHGAENLPERVIQITGNYKTSVTQLQQQTNQTSGMAYIVQLADGSFIIYDGGYANTVPEMFSTLRSLSPDQSKIHIRAWIITHSHDDHYSGFSEFSKKVSSYKNEYSCEIVLDHVLISPFNASQAVSLDSDGKYFNETIYSDIRNFPGAKVCKVYTGMEFVYGNMNLEILFTANELFIDGGVSYFNESSLVSRIYSNTPENGDTFSMIFLGDAGSGVANRLMTYYGDYIQSDMCQISHHGVENFPLAAYEMIGASILFYPCNTSLYNLTNRDADVRKALRESPVTKEILLRDDAQYRRYFNPLLNTSSSN